MLTLSLRSLQFAGYWTAVFWWGLTAMGEEPAAKTEGEWIKSSAGFGAQLMLTDEPDKFLEAWNKPTRGVDVTSTTTAVRGKPLVAFVLFAGAKADAKGEADVAANVSIWKPDGSAYAPEHEIEIWQNKPAPKNNAIELGVGQVGVNIEQDDPDGKYQVRVKVHDRVSGANVELRRSFQVRPRK